MDGMLSRAEIDGLADEIAKLAAHIDAATHRLLTLIRKFDEADGWHRQGALSCAHWLSWRIGMGLGAAREKVRVARALANLPLIDEALRRGEVSYSKVRAMTRVATPAREAELLEMARLTTAAQLEKICRLRRQVIALEGAEPRDIEDHLRRVVSRPTDDGMVSIQLRLLPDEAARVLRAIEACAGEAGSLADGAVAMAEAALGGGTPHGPHGVSAGRPPVEVVVHVSAETLEGHTEPGDGISAETARRLLCDAGVVPMLEDARGQTIDVGRKTRTIPAALRRALRARDRGCRFPGCTNARHVDGHHIHHWIRGGQTSLDNTVMLCRRHHRYVHEYGFSVERSGDDLVFRDPDGRLVPPTGARPPLGPGALDRLRREIRASGIHISAETSGPGWDGWPVDYDACASALA